MRVCEGDKPAKPFNLFMTAQSMIARNQMKFDRERGVAREQLLNELTAPSRQNHRILETVEDRCFHRPESIEAGLPIAVAFLDPFP